jgi:hypothetical protein
MLLLLKIINDEDGDNGSVLSATLIASMSSGCGASSGWDGDCDQIRKVVGSKQQQTSDKGCPPVWWLREVLTNRRYALRNISQTSNGTDPLQRYKEWELNMRFGMGLGYE